MRKTVALVTLIALVATLVVPVAALAIGPPPGKGPASTPPGLAKQADRIDPAGPPARTASEDDSEAAEDSNEAAEPGAKGKARSEQARENAKARSEQAREMAQVRSAEETGTPDGGRPAAEGKERGIANALSRIMRNIERSEARVEAGEQSHVPSGLLRVMAQFFGWLGIDSEPDVGTPDDGGSSDEETSTVLPDTGSDEETQTIDTELE